MSWVDFLVGVAKVGVATFEHAQFLEFLRLDRTVAMNHLSTSIQRLSPQQLDQFEADFLQHSLVAIDMNDRRRAMELYAWFKLQETVLYGQFRGFIPSA